MDYLFAFCKWLERTPLGTEVRQSLWLFPTIETVHVLGIVLLLSTIAMLDLRLLGFSAQREPVSQIAGRLLPWSWAGFGVMVATGSLLFTSNAAKLYINNPSFQIKMLLILLAGVNALVYHLTVYRRVTAWDTAPVTPLGARIAGALSLLLWVSVVFAGRWIGFM